jgi:two-component system, chemotaxis family, protein-glutamate methylesterase/glutaminase
VPKIRVLVVDDAVVFRRLVSEVLAGDPALEVVGTAPNGRIALARVPQVAPDLVVLDVEMPEMDGLATLAELRKLYPRLPVIMFSALTERGARATLDALALGAADYFTKPDSPNGVDGSLEVVRDELIPRIKALCRHVTAPTPAPPGGWDHGSEASGAAAPGTLALGERGSARVLALGTSTGGPNALAAVLGRLPVDLPVPVVIVQHMPPMFTRLLAERLSAEFAIPVHEGTTGALLEPGRALIAPGDYHMVVSGNGPSFRVRLHQEAPENSCRPAVDVLFRSVAKAYGAHALAVVLTGMGQDGLRGCEAIRAAGGRVIVQDEASSVVWGMPGAVARAGLADRVLPLDSIADEILGIVVSGCSGRGG